MVTKLYDDEIKNVALRKSAEILGNAVIGPGGPRHIRPETMLRFAADLRDRLIWKFPILPGATQIFQQLSSGREWQVVAKLRPALRAVEFLNNAKTVDINTGLVQRGFEDYLKRRSLDFVAVGRMTYHIDDTRNKDTGELEYLDPTLLTFQRKSKKMGELSPKEKCWIYSDGRTFTNENVRFSHTLPIGAAGLFISPLAYLVPTAMLAWLVREHDSASADGRRIRDIFVVGSPELAASIEEAVLTQLALFSGEDPTKLGLPIVEMSNLSGQPVADLITTLGLSKIPEGFNREEFVFDYVNQIAAALGLSLRHFWNSERTTNRALEEIQEQRQLQKGPSSYVRSEEREINQSGMLKRFAGGRQRIQFNFIEEVDTSSALNNANVLKATAEALEKVATVFQAGLSLDALLSWMQSIHVLPNDMELITPGDGEGVIMPPQDTAATSPDQSPVPKDGEKITQGDANAPTDSSPAKSLRKSAVPDYDEVAIDSHGNIRERRYKVYSVKKAISDDLKRNPYYITEPVASDDTAYEEAIAVQQLNNRSKVNDFFVSKKVLPSDIAESLKLFSFDERKSAFEKIKTGQLLSDNEQTIIDFTASLLDELGSTPEIVAE